MEFTAIVNQYDFYGIDEDFGWLPSHQCQDSGLTQKLDSNKTIRHS